MSIKQGKVSIKQGKSVNQTHPMWGQRDPTPVCYNLPLSRGTSVNQTGTGSLNQRQKVLCGAWVWVWCKTVISKQSGYHKTSCKTEGVTIQHNFDQSGYHATVDAALVITTENTSCISLDTMQHVMSQCGYNYMSSNTLSTT